MRVQNTAFMPLLLSLVISLISSPIQADPILAKWQSHQIEFKYMGLTTTYTCSGIESTIRSIMKGLGARDDIRVEARCAWGSNVPSKFIDVQMAFAMAVPVEDNEISGESFPAEWQDIHVRKRHPRTIEPGDCELIEELNRHVFPQIGARNIDDKTRCAPYRISFSGINTKMMLLIPTPEEELEMIID
jgi:hypothetical protein